MMDDHGMDTMMNLLEEEILAATDEEMLSHPDASAVAARTRALVRRMTGLDVAVSTLPRPVGLRRDRRRFSRLPRPSPRQVVQRVLVASARARSEIGMRSVNEMTDNELEDLLRRFDALGLIASADDDGGR